MRHHTAITVSAIAVVLTAQLTGPAVGASTQVPTKAPTNMVLVPRGEFKMGSAMHSDESLHNVVLDAYYLDKYEVSNQRYGEFMKATGHAAPAYWDDKRLNKPEQPVVGVNWLDAKAFCEFDGKRLPTEAEWEKAAKGPAGDNHYPWGHRRVDTKHANYGQNVGFTTAVDSYPEGVSGYGAYNMAGNVFEWVADWYDPKYYNQSPALNPQGPEKAYKMGHMGEMKVLRGGSWLAPEQSLHTSHRFWNRPENNSYGVGLGFRCAMNAPEDFLEASREAYIQALISMGAEKPGDALASIGEALKGDPGNREYRQLLTDIKKQMKTIKKK